MQNKRTKDCGKARNPKGTIVQDIFAGDFAGVCAHIKKGENVNRLYGDPRRKGRQLSPVHLAVELGSENLVHTLVQGGADVNLRDSLGVAPLISAMKLSEPKDVLGRIE